MKTLTCLTCKNEMIAVVNSQNLDEVIGFFCALCGTYTSFCKVCGEEFTTDDAAQMVTECGGYCKYNEEITEEDFAQVDSALANMDDEIDTGDLSEEMWELQESWENSR